MDDSREPAPEAAAPCDRESSVTARRSCASARASTLDTVLRETVDVARALTGASYGALAVGEKELGSGSHLGTWRRSTGCWPKYTRRLRPEVR